MHCVCISITVTTTSYCKKNLITVLRASSATSGIRETALISSLCDPEVGANIGRVTGGGSIIGSGSGSPSLITWITWPRFRWDAHWN